MTDPRSDTLLQAATHRVQAAVSDAIDKLVVQLAPLSLSAGSNAQRQALTQAERALEVHGAQIRTHLSKLLSGQTDKAVRNSSHGALVSAAQTDWAALTLVDNAEVERGVSADRLAQTLIQACDGALEALNAYTGALLHDPNPAGNPLRPQAVAKSLLQALADALPQTEAPELIETLSPHLARVLAPALNAGYGQIVADLKAQGIQPLGLSVHKQTGAGGSRSGASSTGASGSSLSGDLTYASTQPGDFGQTGGLPSTAATQPSQRGGARYASPGAPYTAQDHLRAAQALSDMFGVSMPGAPLDGPLPVRLRQGGGAGQGPAVNADFQNLLRQISQQSSQNNLYADLAVMGAPQDAMRGGPTGASQAAAGFAGPLMAVNMIRAHREELVRASGGAALDQMVIDIVAALFDQVVSDPKVAPQMARQIARLQMPVLRVALGDMGFFNSRKHPVRRFVNRIATLSASFDDYEDGAGRACVDRITALVNDIVDGDFDRMDLYEAKLAELEAFINTESDRDAAEQAAVAALLNGKEADLRVQQRYMQILQRELKDVEMPGFVREFLAQIWSQVQVMASARDGAESPLAVRMKKAGHELALSVQPKGHPQLRKAFLLKLPQLMKDLNEGLGLIQWAEEAKQAFFSELLPAHAECLKTAPHHELTQRMLEQQLVKVERMAIPSREDAANDPMPAALDDLKHAPKLSVVSAFTAAEVQQAGFVSEAALASDGPLDINLDLAAASDPALSEVDINLDSPPPPCAGLQLIHHIQKGTAYQMMMQGQLKRVRLTWISEGRNFFIFTHGHTHKQTISLTARTLAKMCESGRFKAFEQAELIERATVRARKQLAALSAAPKTRSAA